MVSALYASKGTVSLISSCEALALTSRDPSPLKLNVDIGNGATYIVPTLAGNVLTSGVRRLDYAGKLLTKLLIQSISLRQLKLNEHYLAAEHAKEEMCYVALDFKDAIKNSNIPVEYYALPDADIKMRGFRAATRDESNFHQYIQLAHERFVVPEHIFNPAM